MQSALRLAVRATAVIASAVIASAAHAELRQFQFTGYVNQGLPMAPQGSPVTGTFSYDTSAAPWSQFGDASGPGYGTATYVDPRGITLRVNGHTLTAPVTRIDIVNNFGGNIEDAVSAYGLPMTLDGTHFPDGNFGIYLGSGPGKSRVLQSTKLPNAITVPLYDGMNYGWAQVDGSSSGTVLSFVITKVERRGD